MKEAVAAFELGIAMAVSVDDAEVTSGCSCCRFRLRCDVRFILLIASDVGDCSLVSKITILAQTVVRSGELDACF